MTFEEVCNGTVEARIEGVDGMMTKQDTPTLSPSVGEEAKCFICAEALKPDDICATDISEGTCHAACLEGSPVVDLDTGEEVDGPVDTFRYGDAEAIPVDRSAVQLTSGDPVTENHRDIDPSTGQQKGYVVLTPDERAKGFVRPYRDAYRHLKCGKVTTMGRALAETYACDPSFYSGTFCSTCREHFPVGVDGEFTWYEMDGREGPKVGT